MKSEGALPMPDNQTTENTAFKLTYVDPDLWRQFCTVDADDLNAWVQWLQQGIAECGHESFAEFLAGRRHEDDSIKIAHFNQVHGTGWYEAEWNRKRLTALKFVKQLSAAPNEQ